MAKVKAKEITRLEDLTPDPANPNKGSERGAYMIDWSLTQLGAARSLVADRSGVVLAGNKTLEAAVSHGFPVRVVQTTGEELVVVQRTDLDINGNDAQRQRARQVSIADNRSSEVSYVPDISMLLAHQQSGVDLTPMYREDEIKELLDSLTPAILPGGGGDEFDATPVEGPTRCQVGDLWVIGGKHRLLCGDSTKAEDVARVMGGERAAVIATDPPYSVGYVNKARDMHSRGYGHSRATLSATIGGDEIDEEQAEQLWRAAFGCAISQAARENAAWYVWHAQGRATRTLLNVMADLGFLHHQTLIWVKNNFVIGRCDYQWQHEPCWYGWQQGSRPAFYGPKNQTTVWNISRDPSPEHPTQKPIALWAPAVLNHTLPHDILFDGFAGSGPALVACHRESRRAYMCEVSPVNADTILRRAEAEGLAVEKANG